MWKQTKSVLCLPGIEVRTAQRLESNNIRAFYQFISCFFFFFPMQIFGVFLPFSLDLCPGKQKKKERIHGQPGKEVSQPPSCFKRANSTGCWTGKGSNCWCWDCFVHRVPAAISWLCLRKGLSPGFCLYVRWGAAYIAVSTSSTSLTCQQRFQTLNKAKPICCQPPPHASLLALCVGNVQGKVDSEQIYSVF